MSADETFQSSLGDSMADFIAFKRMQGYEYSGRVQKLKQFDRFLLTQGNPDSLCPKLFSTYLETLSATSASTREGCLSAIRQFSLYLHAHRPESAVVPCGILPPYSRNPRFCRIEPDQVAKLMEAATELGPAGSVRGRCICFLIGLLYTSGLRIGEALKLNLGDFDPDQATLFVRRGKFGKERLVALSPSTAAALNAWLETRSAYAAGGASAPLLIGRPERRLSYLQASGAFCRLCNQCGLRGELPTRLHDLRHNFACSCIRQWRENGEDIQVRLPILANAMGHVDYFATQRYLHIDADDLQKASDLFRTHSTTKKGE